MFIKRDLNVERCEDWERGDHVGRVCLHSRLCCWRLQGMVGDSVIVPADITLSGSAPAVYCGCTGYRELGEKKEGL